MNNSIGILGCGWLGLPLAESLIKAGHKVHGTTTSKEKLHTLNSKGIKSYLVILSEDGITGNMSDFLEEVETLVVNVPPKLRGANQEDYVLKMRFLHHSLNIGNIKKLIFVSSTSVYGKLEGEVTEATPPRPNTASGRQLLTSESIFLEDPKLNTTIIRFGGLIGPDRHPARMLSGKKDLTNGNEYINLIHQDDCIRIIKSAIEQLWSDDILNGVYPYHATKENYYVASCNKLGLQPPDYKRNEAAKGKKVVSNVLLNVKKFDFLTTVRI